MKNKMKIDTGQGRRLSALIRPCEREKGADVIVEEVMAENFQK